MTDPLDRTVPWYVFDYPSFGIIGPLTWSEAIALKRKHRYGDVKPLWSLDDFGNG